MSPTKTKTMPSPRSPIGFSASLPQSFEPGSVRISNELAVTEVVREAWSAGDGLGPCNTRLPREAGSHVQALVDDRWTCRRRGGQAGSPPSRPRLSARADLLAEDSRDQLVLRKPSFAFTSLAKLVRAATKSSGVSERRPSGMLSSSGYCNSASRVWPDRSFTHTACSLQSKAARQDHDRRRARRTRVMEC